MSVASITSTITTAANGLANLILVNPQQTVGYQPQPNNEQPQQPALLFHYEGENTVVIESDITDHYVEDNTALQDQIALKPVIVTVHGFIGELNDIAPNALFAALQTIASKLTVLGPYTPALSATALNAYNEALFLYETGAALVNAAQSTWASINGGGGEAVIDGNEIVGTPSLQTKQQIMFQQFFGYWSNRTLFTIQTPWAVFQNMAVKSVRAIQDGDTNTITDFEVTFKAIQFANEITVGGLPISDNSDSPLAEQSSSAVFNTSTPSPVTQTPAQMIANIG